MFLIKRRWSAHVQYFALWLEATVQNPLMSSWTVAFSTYGSVSLEFFQTVFSEINSEKSNHTVFKNIKSVFLLTACANIGQLSIQAYVMFMITNLIESGMEELILNHLIANNCPEFCKDLQDSYFFKLTLGNDYLWI